MSDEFVNIECGVINAFDISTVHYHGDLDEYFDKISKCSVFDSQMLILIDMYKEIKKLKESINK